MTRRPIVFGRPPQRDDPGYEQWIAEFVAELKAGARSLVCPVCGEARSGRTSPRSTAASNSACGMARHDRDRGQPSRWAASQQDRASASGWWPTFGAEGCP